MASNEITLRELRPEDVVAFTRIHNQEAIAAMTLQVPFTSVEERRERLLNRPDQRWIVAERDGEAIGFLGLSLHRGRRMHVGSLGMAVDEAFHGQGVGTLLMAAAVDLADNWYNLRRLELEVYCDNEPAVRLYRRFGFEIEGTHRGYAYRSGRFVDVYSMGRLRNGPPVTTTGDQPQDSSV
jgi:L-phenylalanine/L-methionine N-acetyltransferase